MRDQRRTQKHSAYTNKPHTLKAEYRRSTRHNVQPKNKRAIRVTIHTAQPRQNTVPATGRGGRQPPPLVPAELWRPPPQRTAWRAGQLQPPAEPPAHWKPQRPENKQQPHRRDQKGPGTPSRQATCDSCAWSVRTRTRTRARTHTHTQGPILASHSRQCVCAQLVTTYGTNNVSYKVAYPLCLSL
jgi:hypothetical protein